MIEGEQSLEVVIVFKESTVFWMWIGEWRKGKLGCNFEKLACLTWGPNPSLVREKLELGAFYLLCRCAGREVDGKTASKPLLLFRYAFFLICQVFRCCLASVWISFRGNRSTCSNRFCGCGRRLVHKPPTLPSWTRTPGTFLSNVIIYCFLIK